MKRLVLPILLLVALAPLASAHVQSFSDTKTVIAGPYTIILNPSLSPVYTNTLLTIGADVTGQDGMYVRRRVELVLISPDGTNKTLEMRRSANGGQEAPTALFEKGNHTLIARVTDENGTYEGRVWLDVYPSLPYQILPYDETQDIAPGEPTVFAVRLAQRGATTPPPLEDLRGSIELWNNDHSQILRQENVTFQLGPEDATWRVEHTFPEVGMYHVRFASTSGNFTLDDIPLLHTYAAPAPATTATRTTNDTPLPASMALIALALLALAARR